MIHVLDNLVVSLIYLFSAFIIFFVGKLLFDVLHRSFRLNHELVEKDNFALGIAMAGYYLGLTIAIGGSIVGPSNGLLEDMIDIIFFGLTSIILLNISILINDKLILHSFKNVKEVIEDQNCGTGAVECASYIASGLIIYGAVSGEGGSLVTAAVFWALGQAALVVAGLVYDLITPYNLHEQIEKDNVAAGVGFAGALIAVGNVVRWAISGDFVSWSENILEFVLYGGAALVLLPLVRLLVDMILLPGRKLSDEISRQERPNLGAAFIEASSYVGASFLLTWCL
jgi:uncharacterized membrane protein YjfL (UPF0719 family)